MRIPDDMMALQGLYVLGVSRGAKDVLPAEIADNLSHGHAESGKELRHFMRGRFKEVFRRNERDRIALQCGGKFIHGVFEGDGANFLNVTPLLAFGVGKALDAQPVRAQGVDWFNTVLPQAAGVHPQPFLKVSGAGFGCAYVEKDSHTIF
jgi:hypothetical protein